MQFLVIDTYENFFDVFITNCTISINHEYVQVLFSPKCLLNDQAAGNPIVDAMYLVIEQIGAVTN